MEEDDKQSDTIDVESTDPQDIFEYDTKLMFSNNNKTTTKRAQKNNKNKCSVEDPPNDTENTYVQVLERFRQGCDCNENCFNDLCAENVYRHRLNIAELTKEEHDMYLMGVTMACLKNRKQTSRNKDRQRQRASYVFQGKKVCLESFLYLENLTLYHLKRIRYHVMTHGVTPRVHGNIGKKPHNTFSFDMYKCAESFVKTFLSKHTTDINRNVVLPGETRSSLYNKFKETYSGVNYPSNDKIMGYSTFRHFMKKQFPNVKFISKHIDHQSIKIVKDKHLKTLDFIDNISTITSATITTTPKTASITTTTPTPTTTTKTSTITTTPASARNSTNKNKSVNPIYTLTEVDAEIIEYDNTFSKDDVDHLLNKSQTYVVSSVPLSCYSLNEKHSSVLCNPIEIKNNKIATNIILENPEIDTNHIQNTYILTPIDSSTNDH